MYPIIKKLSELAVGSLSLKRWPCETLVLTRLKDPLWKPCMSVVCVSWSSLALCWVIELWGTSDDGLFQGRSKFLDDEEGSHGVNVYDYPLLQSMVCSVPSERLQEDSKFGKGYGSELRKSTWDVRLLGRISWQSGITSIVLATVCVPTSGMWVRKVFDFGVRGGKCRDRIVFLIIIIKNI